MWTQDSFDGVNLVGITRADFNAVWAPHMQLWRPQAPEGVEYFRLVELRFVADLAAARSGGVAVPMGQHVYLQTEAGAPVPNCAVAQGWKDGPVLPPDSIPAEGDPRQYPNRGNVAFSNPSGVSEWIWGAGEGFDPITSEGPHWYWVPSGPSGLYTDVVYGFGWRWGTNHYHLEPVFERVTGGDEPPVTDDWLKVLLLGIGNACLDAAALL